MNQRFQGVEQAMSQVLVTGAGGFVGSHLCEALVRAGRSVQALVHTDSNLGWLEDLPQTIFKELKIVSGDICDPDAMRKLIQGQSLIVHLAALTSGYALDHSRAYIETNVTGTLNLLHAALGQDCHVIHTSTAEVYGAPLYLPIDENHPLQGRSPYVASKIAADMLAESFFRSFQLNLNIVRLFPIFGPRQSPQALIPWLFERINNPVCTEIRLSSLTTQLDLSPIENAISAFLSVAKNKPPAGEVIHFGSGQEVGVTTLAQTMMQSLDIHKPLKASDSEGFNLLSPEHLCCNNNKARALLQWQPLHQWQEGLKPTLAWLQARKQTA
jgi:nucleoside-diphosphate-sugar epimerase